MQTFEDFFAWCDQRGLRTDKQISQAFSRTPQTIRNWRKPKARSRGGLPPRHLWLSCIGYEASLRNPNGKVRTDDMMPVPLFKLWKDTFGLGTLESCGDAFGLTRQAIHNWGTRERLPKWLFLACLGYEQVVCGLADVTTYEALEPLIPSTPRVVQASILEQSVSA